MEQRMRASLDRIPSRCSRGCGQSWVCPRDWGSGLAEGDLGADRL